MNRRPDLIVPIRDRRQHKRYLTLKNFGIACAVAFVAFMGVSIYSEVRRPALNDYGRLAKREVPVVPVTKPVEPVQEATAIDDQSSADPTLVEPMTRAQWLGADATTTGIVEPPPPQQPQVIRHGDDVVVVGDAQGVSIVKQKRRKPVLTGGFGR